MWLLSEVYIMGQYWIYVLALQYFGVTVLYITKVVGAVSPLQAVASCIRSWAYSEQRVMLWSSPSHLLKISSHYSTSAPQQRGTSSLRTMGQKGRPLKAMGVSSSMTNTCGSYQLWLQTQDYTSALTGIQRAVLSLGHVSETCSELMFLLKGPSHAPDDIINWHIFTLDTLLTFPEMKPSV